MYRVSKVAELSPQAADLCAVYDAIPGASGPYANPASLAAVLRAVAAMSARELDELINDLQ